ncbi:hypothetical protein [Caballeronia arationis]|uniref:hypothetical protein n=1 Tax=Caballeronia arationis TaxID=1777142 RepID=UPI001198259B|nr:hypothetical protein [Caballeronia arationis]
MPLAIMANYIVLGVKRTDRTVTDEKFADSCYYLGFIFTITSIIFSLFDLPNIGSRMSLISMRFGTAMLSTVFGLIVRVYWVSFRTDVADAVQAAEEGVVEAAHRLREQLAMALEQFRDFQSQVQDATSMSIAKVNVGVEELAKSYAAKLSEFFDELADQHAKAFKASQSEVHNASVQLARAVGGYSNDIRKSLDSIEKKVVHFTDTVTHRLENTTFPDDYFSERLSMPLTQLGDTTSGLAADVKRSADEIKAVLAMVRETFATVQAHTGRVEPVFERLADLAHTQEALLAGAQSQVDTLSALNSTLRSTQGGIGAMQTLIAAQSGAMSNLSKSVSEQTMQGEQLAITLSSLDTALSAVISDMRRQHESLASAATGANAQSLAMVRMGECIDGLNTALTRVAGSVEHNSTSTADLAKYIKDDRVAASEDRRIARDSLERMVGPASEWPLLRGAVQSLSEQIRDLKRQLPTTATTLPAVPARAPSSDTIVAHAPALLAGVPIPANGLRDDMKSGPTSWPTATPTGAGGETRV